MNGIRACDKKGFRRWLDRCQGDIVGLQEVRAQPDQLPKRILSPKGWDFHLVCAERKGYSGVGLYSREKPDAMETSLSDEAFDIEGRLQIATFGRLVVANGYFPNGNGKDRDNSRVPFKIAFYQRLFEKLASFRKQGYRVLVMGDFNTAHKEIDLARPKQNKKTSGFLIEERDEISRWIDAGWVDTFRHFEKEGGHYTWWSQRQGARQRNVGWRIDYVFACPQAMEFLENAHIYPKVLGSDHCPLGITIDRRVLHP